MYTDAKTFARVIIPSPIKDALVYRVPEHLKGQIEPGMRALVPLGRRKVTGVVCELSGATAVPETKEILALLDERPALGPALLELGRWVTHYYLAPPGEVMATVLPPGLRAESRRSAIARAGDFTVNDPLEKKILRAIQSHQGKIAVNILAREVRGSGFSQALERLETIGAVEIHEHRVKRRRAAKEELDRGATTAPAAPLKLNTEQERALSAIEERLRKRKFETFLLHGVTGGGKTEVYLRAMERAREIGLQSLILIPEISLTPQLLDRLKARFPGRVGILHSGLSAAERRNQWWQIARGAADVVVGARSAVFAPLVNLGLIIVDEEHDPSYKQEEGLRYNGRDVAVVRGKISDCPVVLGSATPAVESYENARTGRYRLLEITKRVFERPLPPVEVVDLRADLFRHGTTSGPPYQRKTAAQRLISPRLSELLVENFHKARQSLLFLNRRGFANFLQCVLCGAVLRCAHCSVTLTLHLQQKSVCCHHCNFRRPVSDLCPECGNPALAGVGAGTEQIEQAMQRIVPGARIARMDRDTTGKRGAQEALLRAWERGEVDILVGTQMITKGHDVERVTLVGALLADMPLNLPDFRSAERTFQLLSQVAGRAGRGGEPGRVIIQTYAPDHYAIQRMVAHDYKGFFATELEFRRALGYPPFGRLVSLRLDGPKPDAVEAMARQLAAGLRESQAKNPKYLEQLEVLGPAPAPIERLRGRYRWQLLLKGKQSSLLLEFARQARELLAHSRQVRLHIDVDPYSML